MLQVCYSISTVYCGWPAYKVTVGLCIGYFNDFCLDSLAMVERFVLALPSVCTLQCLTGKVNENKRQEILTGCEFQAISLIICIEDQIPEADCK